MSSVASPWPCPVCLELLPPAYGDCPSCWTPGGWVDHLLAMDYTIRRFHLWKMEGALTAEQYRAILRDCSRRREEMLVTAAAREAVPSDTGLPAQPTCWNCSQPVAAGAQRCRACGAALDTPAARQIRYRGFLLREVRRHEEAGRISPGQLAGLLTETAGFQVDALRELQQ